MKTMTTLLVFMIVLSFGASDVAAQSSFYVAPNGQPANDGSRSSPWDLQTALSKTDVIRGGDTIYLESGTYEGHYDCRLVGEEGNPIVIRPRNTGVDASPVIIDGKSGQSDENDPTFSIESVSSYIVIRDIHFTSTFENRVSSDPNGADLIWTSGISVGGDNCKIVNCYIYDNVSNGIISGYAGTGNEFYGNVIFHNGCVTGNNNPRSHGAYIQNNDTRVVKTFENNVVFNNYRTGLHGYADNGTIINLRVVDNIFFNNGIMRSTGMSDKNVIVGTGSGGCDKIHIEGNSTYNTPDTQGTGIQVGYGGGNNGACTTRGNRIFNGLHPFYYSGWSTVASDNNKIAVNVQSAPMQLVLPETQYGITYSNYTIDLNEYFSSTPSSTKFIYHHADLEERWGDFSRWQTETGFDGSGHFAASLPPRNWIEIHPNKYEPGRAHVAVFNFENKTTETIDVSGFMSTGSDYVVYDVQNLFGGPLTRGRLTGTEIEVPLNSTAFRKPFGIVVNNDVEHTPSEFNAFLIRSTGLVAVLTCEPLSGTAPLSVTCDCDASSDVDGTIASCHFRLDGGTETTGTQVTYNLTEVGTHTVALRIVDNDAQEATAQATITVQEETPINQAPVALASASPVTGTAPLTVSFSSAGSHDPEGTALSYSWSFGDGSATASEAALSHVYNSAGSYTATLTVTDAGAPPASATYSVSIEVTEGSNRPPNVGMASVSPLAVAPGTPVTCDASSVTDPDGDNVSIEWDFGDGANSTTRQLEHVFSSQGVYTITISAQDDGAPAIGPAVREFEVRVTTNQAPLADGATVAPLSGVAPLTISFDATACSDPDGDSLSYQWSFVAPGGQTEIVNEAQGEHTLAQPGQYTVRLRVEDDAEIPLATMREFSVTVTEPAIAAGVVGSCSCQSSDSSPVAALAMLFAGLHCGRWRRKRS